MNKHTPGPWRTIESTNTTMRTVVGPDFPGQGYIADVNLCRTNDAQDVDGEANARLIAAAPELLEELKETLTYHPGVTHGRCGFCGHYGDDCRANRIKALINKAEGREV